MTIDQKGNKGTKEEGSKQHPGDTQSKEEDTKQIQDHQHHKWGGFQAVTKIISIKKEGGSKQHQDHTDIGVGV